MHKLQRGMYSQMSHFTIRNTFYSSTVFVTLKLQGHCRYHNLRQKRFTALILHIAVSIMSGHTPVVFPMGEELEFQTFLQM